MGERYVRYKSFLLEHDDDNVRCIFYVHQQLPNVGIRELYAILENVHDDDGPSYISNTDAQIS